MFQWENRDALEEYKKSFVLKMMNKRAVSGSVEYLEPKNSSLDNYIRAKKVVHKKSLYL